MNKASALLPYSLFGAMLLPVAVLAEKPLRFVTLINPPLEFPDEKDESAGIVVDLVRIVAKKLNIAITIDFIPWKRAQLQVKDGLADGIFNIGKSKWRESWSHFTHETVYTEQYCLFIHKDFPSPIDKELLNAYKYMLGTQRGYKYGGIIQVAIDQGWFKLIVPASDLSQNISMLNKNTVNLFVGDLIPTKYYIKLHGAAKIVPYTIDSDTPHIFSHWPTYIAFSKKTVKLELVNRFDNLLREAKIDGTMKSILERYK